MTVTEPLLLKAGRTDRGKTLVEFLSRKLGISGKKAKRHLDDRTVFVNRKRVWMAKHTLQPGDTVEIQRADNTSTGRLRQKALFEDERFLIVNKPAGMVSTGSGSVEQMMRNERRNNDLQAVHRLDSDTSGCLMLAKDGDAFAAMVDLFRKREVRKLYHAIVSGKLGATGWRVSTAVEHKPAVSVVNTIRSGKSASHVEVRIVTGRTHQVRRHLASIRHPVVGDKQYGVSATATDDVMKVGRQMLHAALMEFIHPFTGRDIAVHAPFPPDFRRCLRMFGLK